MSEKSKDKPDIAGWEYRVFLHFDDKGNSWVDVREAYYSKGSKDNPHSYAGRAINIVGHNLKDLKGSVDLISKAFDKKVLEYPEFDKRPKK